MKYEFQIKQNNHFNKGIFDSKQEKFESAVNCSSDAVKSILSGLDISIECSPPIITLYTEFDFPFTIEECAKKIKGAFCCANGNLYPEFTKITYKLI